MPRRAFDPSDLGQYQDTDTLTVSQVAVLLEMDKRAVRALVRAGAFRVRASGSREMHIYAACVRDFRQWLDRPSTAASVFHGELYHSYRLTEPRLRLR